MKNTIEARLPYPLLALIVLAAFYGIYFGKMLAQRRRGIQTRQIGRRKEKGVHRVEMLMSVATLGVPAAQLISIACGWNFMPAGARFTGFCIGMLGDAIFLISALCMKDSWRAGIRTGIEPRWSLRAFTATAAIRRFSALICNMRALR